MDGDATALDQGFCYDVADGIEAIDVVSFLYAVRAIPEQSVEELCSGLDETEVISFNFLRKQIQDYAEEKRNSFTDGSEGSSPSKGAADVVNDTGNLEGCGGDISAAEPDFSELLMKNSSLLHSNTNLREENSQLRKQLDLYEEECEMQRNVVTTLEKELRQVQGSKPEVQQLIKDKDDMLNQIRSQEEDAHALQHRCKIIKEEADDYRLRLSCLQDQYDSITIMLDQTRKENLELRQENEELKSACENNQLMLNGKDEQVATKAKDCQVLQEKVADYETIIKDLQEEKEVLLVQVREVQLEHSIYQKAATGSAPGTPTRDSIQHELALAENESGASNYPSPLCGTNYVKVKRQDSPLMGTLRRSLVGSISSPPSFSKTPQKEKVQIVETCDKASSTELEMHERSTAIEFNAFTTQMHSQTDSPALVVESANQTVCMEVFAAMTQTDEHEGMNNAQDFNREDELFEKQSGILQSNIATLSEEKEDLRLKNEELRTALDRERSKIHYLNTQMGANRAKITKLQEILSSEQEKVIELTNINVKLCSGKLDLLCDNEAIYSEEMTRPYDEPDTSQLIDALYLASPPVKSGPSDDDLHGSMRLDEKSCKKLAIAYDADKASRPGRIRVLERCKEIIQQAIKSRLLSLHDILHEIIYCEDYAEFSGVWQKRKWSKSFSEGLKSLESLAVKLAGVSLHIGATQEERKQQSVINALTGSILAANEKCGESQEKLLKLFDLSIECRCFSSIGMLSLLKDVKQPDRNRDDSPSREPISPTHPTVQRQLQSFHKTFEEYDKSLATRMWKHMPSKFRLMVLLFLMFAYSTFRWEDYHVPQVV